LFWPAVLQGAGMRRPTGVHAHGFVTINGQKMSKSRGTFVTARRYLDSFPPEYLRYYYAAKLAPGIDDLDLNLEEFATRLNSDIVGKLVNIASRCAGFISRNAGGRLSAQLPDLELYAAYANAREPIAAAYEARDYATAIRDIMALADRANQYIDQQKPWTLVKQPNQADAVRGICTQGLNLFRALMIYLKPVLPAMAGKAEEFFAESPWRWDDAARPRLDALIRPYEALALRLDPKAVAALIEPVVDTTPPATPSGMAGPISIEDFARLDLRVAKILTADFVAGSDKLLKLRVDLGEHGEREIFSGIRGAYDPANLVGRLTVVVANLEPRKMRFGISAGMVLAAGAGGKDIFLLTPDSGAGPGMRIK
jgi:methionyl-tRNA synthetase